MLMNSDDQCRASRYVTAQERRKSMRARANLFLAFKRLSREGKESLPEMGYTRDISRSGMYFYTSGKPKKGEKAVFVVYTGREWTEPGVPPRLEGKGKVLRVERPRKELPPAQFYGVAVQFEEELALSL